MGIEATGLVETPTSPVDCSFLIARTATQLGGKEETGRLLSCCTVDAEEVCLKDLIVLISRFPNRVTVSYLQLGSNPTY